MNTITQPLPPNSTQVTVSADRLSRIKNLNKTLESISQDDSLKQVNDISKRIKSTKAHILDKTKEIPSDEVIEDLQQKQKVQKERLDEIENIKKQANNIKMNLEKYDQTKAFLSILIEKALNIYYPKIKTEESIHEKIIQSVEEDQDFKYGTEILEQIRKNQV